MDTEKVQRDVTAAVPEGTTAEGVEPPKDETPETDPAEVQEAVTAAAPEESDAPADGDETDPAEVRAEVTAATAESVTDPAADDVPPGDVPKHDGRVEIEVKYDLFSYFDKDGMYRSASRGDRIKVTAAQADRGEALGAVERV